MAQKKAQTNGNGKLTTNNPTDISAILDAKPDQNDSDFEFDVSIQTHEIEEDKLEEYSRISGIPKEKLIPLIVNDAINGGGKIKLLNAFILNEKEREKQRRLEMLKKAKIQKQLELEQLEIQAKAISGVV